MNTSALNAAMPGGTVLPLGSGPRALVVARATVHRLRSRAAAVAPALADTLGTLAMLFAAPMIGLVFVVLLPLSGLVLLAQAVRARQGHRQPA